MLVVDFLSNIVILLCYQVVDSCEKWPVHRGHLVQTVEVMLPESIYGCGLRRYTLNQIFNQSGLK